MMLGLQMLRNMGTKIDCVNQAIHFEALDLFIPWAPLSSSVYTCLRISEEREIPPKTHVWVPTKIVDDSLIKEIGHREQCKSFYVEGIQGENYDFVVELGVIDKLGNILLLLTNSTDEMTTVSCDTELAKVSLLDPAVTILDDSFDDCNFVSTEGQKNSLESANKKKTKPKPYISDDTVQHSLSRLKIDVYHLNRKSRSKH